MRDTHLKHSGSPGIRAVDVHEAAIIKLNCSPNGTPDAGDFTSNGDRVMDGDVSNYGQAGANAQYCGLDFGGLCSIYGYRQYGNSISNTNTVGKFKLQYEDEYGVFQDIVTGLTPRDTDDWSTYTLFSSPVTAKGLRIVITTYDGNSRTINEVEVRGWRME